MPVRQRLEGLAARAAFCNPLNAQFAKDFFQQVLDHVDTDEARAHTQGLVTASMEGDRDARMELGRTIAVNVGHLIRAAGTWVQWYETRTLAEDETAFLRNFVPQQVDVRVSNADGTLSARHAMPNIEDNSIVDLYFLLSDPFIATLFDPNKGNVADAALGVVDISMDLMEKLDSLLQLPFTVGSPNSVFVANFIKDGTPASHFHASSRIKTANFPAGNIIAPTSNGANTQPRFDCIKAIDEYFGRFGSGFDVDGDMVPVAIHVSSGIAHQFGNEFSPTSHANALTNQLFQNIGQIQFNGKTYQIISDNTIDLADKHLYVRSNLPAGLHFEKPAGAHVHRVERIIENEVETFERGLFGQAFPVTWVPRVLAVKFKD